MPRVEKTDLAVLVVRGALARRRELDRVVLPRMFDHDAEFRGVVADHLRHVVGPGIHKTGPRTRVRTAVERGQSSDSDRGDLAVGQLRAREQEREVESVGAAIAECAARRIEVNGPGAVGVERKCELVQQ